MSDKRIDLTGKRFGRLTVVKKSDKNPKDYKTYWDCVCDCGNETTVLLTYLTSGETKSCGCLRIDGGSKLQKYNEEELRVDGVFTPLLSSKVRIDNTTGHKGVTFDKKLQKYRAQMSLKGKKIHLGYYHELEDAVKARKQGEEKFFKPYLEEKRK